MISAIKKTASVIALLFSVTSLYCQTDSLTLDSVTSRIKEILEEYNTYAVYIDTSDYVHDVPDADNWNLQTAASHGACNEIIRLYVRGADVNNRTGDLAGPIHYAVSSGRWEAVEILLLLGADPHLTDYQGNTPLVVAVRANNPDIAEKLIRYGASPDLGDRNNSTPLHHASALGNFVMTDMLLYYDAPMEMHDSEGNTPLMTAVCFGYHDIADLLLQSGADPNAPDRKGFTPLMAASQNGDTLIMRILASAGASLYTVNNEGLDALGCAVLSSEQRSAEYLLGIGNHWNHTSGTKAYPANIAHNIGNRAILQILTDNGLNGRKTISFNVLSFSAGGIFTSHYALADASVSVSDPSIRTGITLGITANPVSQRMLVSDDNDRIFQYRVKSTLIHAGLHREYRINKPYQYARWTFVPSLSAGYRFHSLYEGTEERPDNRFVIIPAADLRLNLGNIGASAGIMYLKMPFYKAGPVWFTLKASYILTRTSGSFSFKKVRLYNYEQN